MKALALALILLGTELRAATWVESLNGDLSGNGAAPTVVSLDVGSNIFEGTFGFNGSAVDSDIFTFTIGAGEQLTGINLLSYTPVASSLSGSFIALDDAATIDMANPATHLSNGLFNASTTNLLGYLDAGPLYGGTGFAGPLTPGTYTMWVRESSTQVAYRIELVKTAAVPEPSSLCLGSLASLVALRRRRLA